MRKNNEEWFDAHLNKVQKVAALWEMQGRPSGSGLLMVGEELTEAQCWASTQTSLTEGEKKFLAASVERQLAVNKERRQARRLRWLAGVATISRRSLRYLISFIHFPMTMRSLESNSTATSRVSCPGVASLWGLVR